MNQRVASQPWPMCWEGAEGARGMRKRARNKTSRVLDHCSKEGMLCLMVSRCLGQRRGLGQLVESVQMISLNYSSFSPQEKTFLSQRT